MKGSRFFAYRAFTAIAIILVTFFQFNSLAFAGGIERRGSEQLVTSTTHVVDIGVIQTRNSAFDSMISSCIETARSDFYSENPDYKTRLKLQIKYAEDALHADLAVRELLEHEHVHVILGHHGLSQSTFAVHLGRKYKVPIISFTDRGTVDHEYFIRTAPDDVFQALALADICKTYKWRNVVVLYEDSKYGLQFLSHLGRAFKDFEIGVARLIPIPASANETRLNEELGVLNEAQTVKVFLVHMSPSLGSQLFTRAKDMKMMREDHAWIITDWMSNFLNSVDTESMEGVIGVRPHFPLSKDLKDFRKRLKNNSAILDLNVYGLWAYDTLTALALTLEKMRPSVSSTSLYDNLLNTSFIGLSGKFELVGGIRKPPPFEIINVFGTGERRIGFWTVDTGITRDLISSSSIGQLKKSVWPGDSITQPKGWSVPPKGPLRIGVPWKSGFTEFTKVTIDHSTNEVNATGFAVDIFLAALKVLPFPIDYRFICYNGSDITNGDWTYDDMVDEILKKNFDMIVGDTTISDSRLQHVEFSLPYAESVVVLLVHNTKELDMWTFTKPLRWDLWLAILVSCIIMGIVICVLERSTANPTTTEESPWTTYLSPIVILAFNERNMISNKWSRFLLVCWLFTAYILMQSFTANLSAMLAVDHIINASPRQYSSIGCQSISFVRQFLTNQLNIDASKLKYYTSPEELHDAMHNGTIEAVVDEIPYMKLLINRYDSEYKIVSQLMNNTGLGFAFPVGSPLVSYFSSAILNITQGPDMTFIERKNFGPGYSSQDPLSSTLSQGTSTLSFFHFAGLFIIVGSITAVAVVYSERAVILSALIRMAKLSCKFISVDGETENANEHANGVELSDKGEQWGTQDDEQSSNAHDDETDDEQSSKAADANTSR